MAQGSTFQYDPFNVIVSIGKFTISGFADGTFIKVSRTKDMWTTVVGSDGEATRVKSQDRSGSITLTLQQASPSNDDLSTLATQDEDANTGAVPVSVFDKNGSTTITCASAWVKKKSDSEFSNTHSNREWVIETGNLVYKVGGEVQIS